MWFDFLVERWTPYTTDLLERRRDRILVGVLLLLVAVAFLFSLSYAMDGHWILVPLNLLVSVIAAVSLPLLARGRRLLVAHMATAATWLCVSPTLAFSGGADAPYLLWLVVLPLLGGLLGNRRVGIQWGVLAAVTITGFHLLEGLGVDLPRVIDFSSMPMRLLQTNGVVFSVTVLMGVYLWNFESAHHRSRAAISRLQDEMTQRAAIERDLLHTEARDHAKSEFLTSMSHELRTPLNAILGYSELLQEELEDDPDAVKDLDRIRTAGAHLRRLIDDLLDLSRVESGALSFDCVDVDLARTLHELREAVTGLVDVRSNTLQMPDTQLTVRADPVRLQQVLVNLVGNSAKFTENGTIRVTVEKRESEIHLVVADTGCGMSPAQLEHAFKPFETLGRKNLAEGSTGLGLALAVQLVEGMGGRLDAHSTPGKGTTMVVCLPATKRTGEGLP